MRGPSSSTKLHLTLSFEVNRTWMNRKVKESKVNAGEAHRLARRDILGYPACAQLTSDQHSSRHDPNVLLIFYEDLKDDAEAQVWAVQADSIKIRVEIAPGFSARS